MKKAKLISLLLLVILTTPMLALGHSGRTDSSGGHWNRKTGTYHYHNGGSSSSYSPSITVKTPVETPISTQKPFVPSIIGTNIRTYINGYEVPTWAYNGNSSCVVIIAEDLKDYGFDINWNGASKILEIKRNNAKSITPIPMASYRNLMIGATAFNIISSNNVKIILKSDINTYMPNAIYNLGGYMAISVDELKMFGEFTWDSENKTVSIKNR